MTEKYQLTTRKSFLCGITSDDTCYDVQFSNVQLVELLNGYVKENQRLREENEKISLDFIYFKTSLITAIHTERTDLGVSVLKQLADSLGVEY